MKRPNILLLYTDQQRWDTIGALGLTGCKTPHLDQLAAEGALFDHCFVNSPVCMPSRHSMLSGRYAEAFGSFSNGIEMRQDIPCIQHLLQPYGYHTANIGKLHFRNHAHRDHRDPHPACGFDTLILSDEPGCYDDAFIAWVTAQDPAAVDDCRCDTPPTCLMSTRLVQSRKATQPYAFAGPEHLTHSAFVAEETCDFIRRRGEEPFFAIAGFYAPHCPFNPPQRFLDWYQLEDMPLPKRAEDQGTNLSDDQWREVVRHYWALCSHVDDQVGRILHTLDDCGLRDNTLVVFTSDHGEQLGDHGRTGKGQAQDASSRVPLIMRLPGQIPASTRSDAIVEHVDLVPTFLDYAGVQQPTAMPGISLRGLFEPQRATQPPREDAYIALRKVGGPGYKALRTRDHLYRLHNDGQESLFDLATDPHQLVDVATEPAQSAALAACRQRLLNRWFDVDSREPLPTGAY